MTTSIDLNCDMGEGAGNDMFLMPFISSANIACGYHAGDNRTIQNTIELALKHNVKIGAHPSFPDRENFGRTNMYFTPIEIYDMVTKQVELLANATLDNNTVLHHVKPHGALYNMASVDEVLASAICKAIIAINPNLILYAQSGSVLIAVAKAMNLKTVNEVFSDRTYRLDGTLTPRSEPNAVIQEEKEVVQQILQMILQKTVTTTTGETIAVNAQTICIHGDGVHAVSFAKNCKEILQLNNISIKSII